MDPKSENLDDLVYKVMPRGKYSAPVPPPIQQSVPEAPKAPKIPTPPMPAAPSAAAVDSDKELLHSNESFSLPEDKPGLSSKVKYGLVGLGVVILAVGGFFGYKYLTDSKAPANLEIVDVVPGNTPKSVISDEWREKYFSSKICSNPDNCGDAADPDHDGLSNAEEYNSLTDPNNADSDNDGLADGDEKHIFGYDPKSAITSGVDKYNDVAEAKAHWNAKTKQPYTDSELKQIAANVAKYGFNSPTIVTLDAATIAFYTNYGKDASASQSPANALISANDPASLDRDTQRSDTIKQIAFALLKYKQTSGKFPDTTKWDDMIKAIQPLLIGKAVNTTDPKNISPYIYSYAPGFGGDFKLSYYSETQNQLVTLNSKDAAALSVKDQASQRDNQRRADLEQISSGLELYSNDNADPNNPEQNIFPSQSTWKADLAEYLTSIPTDPQTKQDYSYSVSVNKDSFALQVALEVPPTGKKGYLCTPEGCVYN